ncbi:uncharacterized protein LOC123517413 isoform X2 [Portunus trituberculatus]|uniref:uncharacterized protein LOC123517413 isoform X2 n=1 Tax=Portunus trituberculatus TaxID=210409 RepID=UPI001E1CF208|nr:uncharacterized protein LOC123517413 isoform X2 [Portunus trituberculatus]
MSTGEGVFLYGGLGSVTAITLFTIAHALLFNNTTTRRKRDLASMMEASQDDPGLLSLLEGMYAHGGRWCGLRLTCELAAREELDLGPDEKLLFSFFRKVAAAQNLHVSTQQMHHGQATQHALPAARPAQCRDLDGRCPYSARAMMEAYRTAHVKLEQRGYSHLKPSY